MSRCVIPYVPRPLQWRFHEERSRFCVLLCHRRFGKTVAAVNDLIREALRRGGADWQAAYAAPFLGQAKAVAWAYCKRFAGAVPGSRFLESELTCVLPGGARIRLLGTDNAQALRGLYLDDLVLDEPADMPREVWSQVLRPMLADRQGRALFCGTPHGTDNLLYDVWQQAGANEDGQWSRFRFPASLTGYLPEAELAAARRSMEESEYRQEFECSFAAALRGAYYASLLDRAEAEGRITRLEPEPDLPVHTAWDLGMDDATAIWFFQTDATGQWRMLDYYEASGEGLAHYAHVLRQKALPADAPGEPAGRGFCYGLHLAPRDIRVRELGTGQSRLESAARLGIRFSIAPALPLADGIDATRRALPRLWFDAAHCARGIKALRAYRRNWRPRQEGAQGTAGGPLHDWASHAADALRYAVTGFRQAQPQPGPGRARTSYDIFGGMA
ncbi:MAG: terminase family protein [Desulfovibrionaceae bacterium]|nr:terminase family protein [Desulfovibrionaceae bacterium]